MDFTIYEFSVVLSAVFPDHLVVMVACGQTDGAQAAALTQIKTQQHSTSFMTSTLPLLRVYLIDDDLNNQIKGHLEVYGFAVEEFSSGEEFLSRISPRCAGWMVADVRVPDMSGMKLAQEISSRKLNLKVVLVSAHADVLMVMDAVRAGAADFLEKPINFPRLVTTLNRGMRDIFARAIENSVYDELWRRFSALPPHYKQVFDFVARGMSNQDIARELSLSIRTIEDYRDEIMEKLSAKNIADLVLHAWKLGRLS